MRVLVGQDLAHGVLPLWNPYLFSGTPLLGGFNAGAAYPATWLTAVLPIFTAWTLTLAVAYDVALVGMYSSSAARGSPPRPPPSGRSPSPSSGYMTAQQVHIDLIEGAAWLPWILLAVHGLTERRPDRPPTVDGAPDRRSAGGPSRNRAWVLVLALALGLTLLAGAAEAIIDSGVLVAIYWVWRLAGQGYLRRGSGAPCWPRWERTAGRAGRPGWRSARPSGCPDWSSSPSPSGPRPSYSFFTSGSLDNRLLSPRGLALRPGHQPGVAGDLRRHVQLRRGHQLRRASWPSSPPARLFLKRWRTRPEARQWWIWYGILVIGVLSSLGGQTPFARLMYLIPGIRSERLLNRNLLLVDMALAVLLAWWVHLALADGPTSGGAVPSPPPVRARWQAGRRAEVLVTAIPFAFIIVVAVLVWVAGPSSAGCSRPSSRSAPAPGSGWPGWSPPAWSSPARPPGPCWPPGASRPGASAGCWPRSWSSTWPCSTFRHPAAHHRGRRPRPTGPWPPRSADPGRDGRFIIYDPDQFETDQLYALGQTDLNIYRRLPSAQGYTALTDGDYYDATGAHLQEDLDPTTLAGPVWDRPQRHHPAVPARLLRDPAAGVGHPTGVGPDVVAPADRVHFPADPTELHRATDLGAPATATLGPGGTRTWYFGGGLTLDQFAVPVDRGVPADLQVGLVTSTGTDRWLPAADAQRRRHGGRTGRSRSTLRRRPGRPAGSSARPAPAGGGGHPDRGDRRDRGRVPGRPAAVRGDGAPLGLHRHPRQLRRVPQPGRPGMGLGRGPRRGPGDREHGHAVAPGQDGGQRITVHTTGPAVLVRSESWTPGWQATVQTVHRCRRHPAAYGRTGRAGGPERRRSSRCAFPARASTWSPSPTGRCRPWSGWPCPAVAGVGLVVVGGGRGGLAARRRRRVPPSGRLPRRGLSRPRLSPGRAVRWPPPTGRVGGRGHRPGLLGPGGQQGRDGPGVGGQGLPALPDRAEQLDEGVGHVGLQVAVALVGAGHLRRRPAGGHGQQLKQVGQPRLGLGVVADLAVGVGDRLFDLARGSRRRRPA